MSGKSLFHVPESVVGQTCTRLAPNDEVRLLIYPSFTMRYPTSGSKPAAPVTVSATVSLPLLPGNLSAPPDNTP